MLLWKNKKNVAVITDAEELEINKLVNPDPYSSQLYVINREPEIRDRIIKQLNYWFSSNPEEFEKKYISRLEEGANAISLLPDYLNAYSELTNRIKYEIIDKNFFESLIPNDPIEDDGIASYVNIMLPARTKVLDHSHPNNYISFGIESVKRIKGTVKNFTITTNNSQLIFNEKFVRINIIVSNISDNVGNKELN